MLERLSISIKNAKPGLYKLYAYKEEDGYPDPMSKVHRDASAPPPEPEVVVEGKQITRGVIIHFRRKFDRLLLLVADADTRDPIKRAIIIFYSPEYPNSGSSYPVDENGEMEVLMPLVPLNIKVSAKGYEDVGDLSLQELFASARIRSAPKEVKEASVFLPHAK